MFLGGRVLSIIVFIIPPSMDIMKTEIGSGMKNQIGFRAVREKM